MLSEREPSRRQTLARVLVVMAEPDVPAVLEAFLASRGLDCQVATSLAEMRRACARRISEVVVLSERVAGMDAVDECRKLVAERHDPCVLVLLEPCDEAHVLALYAAGASECATLPLSDALLVVKIVAHARPQAPTVRRFGRLVVDSNAGAFVNGINVHVTPLELRLVARLAESPGADVTRDALLRAGWPSTKAPPAERLYTRLRALRQKLAAHLGYDPIEFRTGRGWLLAATLTPALGNHFVGLSKRSEA